MVHRTKAALGLSWLSKAQAGPERIWTVGGHNFSHHIKPTTVYDKRDTMPPLTFAGLVCRPRSHPDCGQHEPSHHSGPPPAQPPFCRPGAGSLHRVSPGGPAADGVWEHAGAGATQGERGAAQLICSSSYFGHWQAARVTFLCRLQQLVLMQALAHANGEFICPHCLCGASTTTDIRLSEAFQCCRGQTCDSAGPCTGGR